jgi:hypothetical protein
MNDELRRGAQPQVIERIYWKVSFVPITRILDVIRTKLVALIAEMRAGTPRGRSVPTREVAEEAVGIAIYGKGHRIVIQQHSPGAVVSSAEDPESPQRHIAYWVGVIATVVAAVAAVIVLV